MRTPHFELSQDSDFVRVHISVPHLRVDEGEFYIIDREFKFHLSPYFLRLTFRHDLVEDGRERAVHDIDTGVLTVWLPKATPGEHFEGLGMLTELLRRPSAAAVAKRGAPLIEVVGETDDAMRDDGEDEGEEEDEMDADALLAADAEMEQQLPSALPPTGASAAYGFNAAHGGIFAGLEDEGLVSIPSPEERPP